MLAGGNGGIKFPALDSVWLTPQQRANFKRLYTEMVNYRKLIVADKFTSVRSYRYTKVAPYTDDAIDALAMLMEESPQVRAPGRLSLTQARLRAG